MSNTKKRSSFVTGLLFFLAIVLLGASTVGSARAALQYQSDIIVSEFAMKEIHIAITDGEDSIAKNGLVRYMLGLSESDPLTFLAGKKYSKDVYITNDGEIDEYMRVVVRKYWKQNGKLADPAVVKPDWITLEVADGWTKDEANSTAETAVYIYTPEATTAGGSVKFLTSVQIDKALRAAKQSTANGETTTTYLYDGVEFCLEIEADGVQTHNAQDAIKSAWGKTVTAASEGGAISLG